jgi:dTDP-glucose 4,6-dehydratase
MERLLVTGAGGFIGSHLVEALLRKNYKVRAFIKYSSNSNTGWLENIKNKKLEIFFGDITDYDSVLEACRGVNKIFNLAALISVPYSFKNPSSFIKTNVNGLINILRACKDKRNKIKKIIQLSSSEVYGNTINKKVKTLSENLKLRSESPYAVSKIAADHLAITSYKNEGTPIVIARPFNTFGPRQSLRAVIPTIISQMIKSNNKKIKLGNIHTSRDFVYVKDTVNALIRLSNSGKVNGQVLNIATNKSHSIKNIINILKKYTQSNPKIIFEKIRKRNTELNVLRGSNKKIKKILNWKPLYGSKKKFSEALIETYKWFLHTNNFNKYKNINKYNL